MSETNYPGKGLNPMTSATNAVTELQRRLLMCSTKEQATFRESFYRATRPTPMVNQRTAVESDQVYEFTNMIAEVFHMAGDDLFPQFMAEAMVIKHRLKSLTELAMTGDLEFLSAGT